MALARLSVGLKKVLFNSPRLLSPQYRFIGSTKACRNDETDKGEGVGEESEDGVVLPIEKDVEEEVVKPPPYAEELRKVLTAKYLSNQPVAHPHSLCEDYSGVHSLEQIRLQYKKKVAAVRKQYILEMAEKRAAKETQDKKQKEEIQRAKEERLRLKKERSAKRAIEVAEENRILQEQLAKEREERRAYRRMMDRQLEEWRQMERDLIRQESGKWIDEKDLESRIVEAYQNPIDL
ncbi:hypothetical protein KP509_35G021400 [Ceratopteris richardii]|uniref:Uncharacterized protein n=1 Tax=Ceratopteris richardii TaxID=49495 RepID=A0A8T2QDQ4_CERRI|nr:hypothetical protein KP509_35G021400 [Ceratopteris richardii]